MSSWFTCGT